MEGCNEGRVQTFRPDWASGTYIRGKIYMKCEVHPGVNVRPVCGALLRRRQGGGHAIIENSPEAEIQPRCCCSVGENRPVYHIQHCHPQPNRRPLWVGKLDFYTQVPTSSACTGASGLATGSNSERASAEGFGRPTTPFSLAQPGSIMKQTAASHKNNQTAFCLPQPPITS